MLASLKMLHTVPFSNEKTALPGKFALVACVAAAVFDAAVSGCVCVCVWYVVMVCVCVYVCLVAVCVLVWSVLRAYAACMYMHGHVHDVMCILTCVVLQLPKLLLTSRQHDACVPQCAAVSS